MVRFLLLSLIFIAIPKSLNAQKLEEYGKIISIQQAQIVELSKKIDDLNVALKETSDKILEVRTIASNAQTAAGNAQMAADTGSKSATLASQEIEGLKKKVNANPRLQSFWNQSGNYSTCNVQCASQGMRCITGQSNTIATSNQVSCSVATNVCLCGSF